MTETIRLDQVTLDYGGDEIIKEASFTVKPGETKVILGPSGVGKSTILKAILGLLRPKKGKVTVQGREISRLQEKEILKLRMRMAMVFQNGALFDTMSVGDNVSYRLREFSMLPKEQIEERVIEVLRFVGMEGAKKLKPSQLSGGMRKRVAIARGLAPDPDIILFDEPTVGLDPVNHHNIEQLIMKLKDGTRRSIVIVTHDIASACKMADSIVMLHQGRFIFEGTPQQLRDSKDPRILAFLNPAQYGN
jgi:phospholipid/cholesterol/gamma-HCH transport system ATP-binding protein